MNLGLTKRRAVQKSLPYDAEIQYLQSSGTQYIDTLVNPLISPKVEIDFELFNAGDNDIIGNKISGSSTFLVNRNNSDVYTRYGSEVYYGAYGVFPYNTYIKVLFSNTLYVNGVKKITHKFVYAHSDSQSNIYIFRSARGKKTSIKCYSCKLWDGDVLVRDYIPVRKGQVGYMYDKVSGQLFGNSGTGNFILGPDK